MQAPFRVVFAGPAAGTVGSAHFGRTIGEANLLCADVGGTSCDISLVTAGQPFVNTTFELEHDLIVNALSNDISASARAAAVSSPSRRAATSPSARRAPAPIRVRPATAAAACARP